MSVTPSPRRFFLERYGLTDGELEHVLGSAVGGRADHADLYFEFRTSESLLLEESIVKKATRAVSQGVGVRVLSRDRTGYAYSDEVTLQNLELAATTARAIAETRGPSLGTSLSEPVEERNLYRLERPPIDTDLARKIDLLDKIDVAARRADSRIRNVIASFTCEQKIVLVVTSAGLVVGDVQPLLRLHVTCIADDGRGRQQGSFGGGGRTEFDFLTDEDEPTRGPRYLRYTGEAVRQALINLEAVDAPAGNQVVVLGPGWPGILLHEAVGHGLEGDFNRKGVSAFSGRMGERVASELCTVVDDGTLANRRGSLNFDDEGTRTGRTVLIERGILRGYLLDRMNAGLLGMPLTGNGRRESFAHIPMPRMTNTFLLAGDDDPADIVRSVDRGLYAAYFGGGQVDITSGKFVFSATEAYLIEGGRITRPVKGATLIGSGPEVLKRITRVGSDLRLDEGVGTCGKNGQSVPVGNGIPTVRIDGLTVGGDARLIRPMDLREAVDLVLREARRSDATAGEALGVEGDSLEVGIRLGEVETLKRARERRVAVRLFQGRSSAVCSTADLAPSALRDLVGDCLVLARATAPDPLAGLPDIDGDAPSGDDLDLYDASAESVTAEEAISICRRAERRALDADRRVSNSEGAEYGVGTRRLVYSTSYGRKGEYRSSSFSLSVVPVVRDGDEMQQDSWYTSARRSRDLESPESVGQVAAMRALRRLGGRPVRSCDVPVVFDPETAASLLAHFAAAVSGSSVYRGTSFLRNRLGQAVLHPSLTILDDPRMPSRLGSRPFDAEGLPTRRNVVFERGVLRTYLLDTYSARKLGLESTASAVRGVGDVPSAGPSNFYLEPGNATPEEIIASVQQGLYVTDLAGFGVNPVTGDYSRGAVGLWIEKGRLSFPVQEVTIAGNLLDMLRNVDRVGNDLRFRASIACPTLKIAQMTVAGGG